MGQYAAGIVLYNPEIGRLKENIDAIYNQVSRVYCFDNGSVNHNQILSLTVKYSNITLIDGNANLGIAIAINQMAKSAEADGIKWLLTLDQDSICEAQMVDKFSKYTDVENVGIICPIVIDKRRPVEKIPKGDLSDVDFCITSGSFMKLDIFNKIGKMDDWLFIGLVDDEYCYRLRLFGYRIIRLNSVILDHELGTLTPCRFAEFFLKLGNIFSLSKIKALSYKRSVSPKRVYYATRNIVYLTKRYIEYPTNKFSNKAALLNAISNVLRGENKIAILQAAIKGFSDGSKIDVKPLKIS